MVSSTCWWRKSPATSWSDASHLRRQLEAAREQASLDGCHVSTVHYNFVAAVRASKVSGQRARGGMAPSRQARHDDAATVNSSGSQPPAASVARCPSPAIYAQLRQHDVTAAGGEYIDPRQWMMHRACGLNLYRLFVIDRVSSPALL